MTNTHKRNKWESFLLTKKMYERLLCVHPNAHTTLIGLIVFNTACYSHFMKFLWISFSLHFNSFSYIVFGKSFCCRCVVFFSLFLCCLYSHSHSFLIIFTFHIYCECASCTRQPQTATQNKYTPQQQQSRQKKCIFLLIKKFCRFEWFPFF